jgi:O-antigen/teichoic acid export membrane protein
MLAAPLPVPVVDSSSLWRLLLTRTLGGLTFRVVATGLAFLTAVVLARAMGVTEYGIYVFALSVVGLANTFFALGMPGLLVREIARARGKGTWGEVRGLSRCARVVTLGGACVAWFAIVGYVAWSREPNGMGELLFEPLVLAGATLPFMAFIALNSACLAGFEHVLTAQSLDSLLRPTLMLLLLLGVWLGSGAFPASVALTVQLASTAAMAGIGALIVHHVVGTDWRSKVSSAEIDWRPVPWIKAGLFLMVNQLLVNATTQIDVLMLGWLSRTSEVATYYASSRGAYLVTFLFGSMTAAVAPSITRLHAAGMLDDLQSLISRAAVLVFLPVLALAVGLGFFSDLFLGLFGSDFAPGRSSLIILIVGWILCVAGGPAQTTLIMCDHHRLAAYAFAACTAINMALGLLLIPTYGAAGAAFATAASLAFVTACWSLAASRLIPVRTDIFFILTARGRTVWAHQPSGIRR